MTFQFVPLAAENFEHLFGMPAEQLAAHGAMRMRADASPGFPCRLTLEDAEVGECVILVNYEHLPVATPYRSSHAVFVRENARHSRPYVNEVPPCLRVRLLSIRAFDRSGMMRKAEVGHGRELVPIVERLLEEPETEFLHVHYAGPGCYAAKVDRA